jgi:hypothetical protein
MHGIALIHSILKRRRMCICGEHFRCVRSRTQPYAPLDSDVRTLTQVLDSWR